MGRVTVARLRRSSATLIAARLGISRKADAWNEEMQAYLKRTLSY
jgi:hypothetical protein